MAEHLIVCPDADRTRLLTEQTGNLREWLENDNKTDLELAYWKIKYILLRGDKPFSENGRHDGVNENPCSESGQNRLEEIHQRLHIQMVL